MTYLSRVCIGWIYLGDSSVFTNMGITKTQIGITRNEDKQAQQNGL